MFLAAFLVMIQGCARPVLQTYPASEQEIGSVLQEFAHYQQISEELCGCCLDAEADAALSVSGWFSDHTGKLSGYLQAMEPGYIRFVAINPLGQPLFILVTNGNMFKSLNVSEEKAYIGSVYSETYRKFAPVGFEPEFSYYWLTGRLQPGDIQIRAVMRDREQDAFWLQINRSGSGTDSMVLFDPGEKLILRHVLRDQQGKHLVDTVYADYQAYPGSDSGKEFCRVPAMITVSSNAGAEKIEVKLFSFLDDAYFSAVDFYLDIPENFDQRLVK